MFIVTIARKQYRMNDIRAAVDIVHYELDNESDLQRPPYILGNMKFNEMFHGNGLDISSLLFIFDSLNLHAVL